ncbi:MAG TPA: ABC transporter permease [Vicinamibacteria bacterium]|jgi:peptide/nickel transport system permease protein
MFAPWLTLHSPEAMDMEARLAGPSASHWLGTDNFGRDLWARVAFGARISLTIALTSVAAALALGTAVGLASGYFGGLLDHALMRVVDLFLAFPPFILALALVAVLGPGVSSVVIALTAIFWTEYARLVRAITLSESRRDYVTAARSLGATDANLLFRQILPRAFGPLAVLATLGIGTAVVAESGLSFLGFGVEPPAPTWGWTLAYGMRYLRSDMWLSTAPGLAILATVLGFNLFGDGLSDRLDPRGLVREKLTSMPQPPPGDE